MTSDFPESVEKIVNDYLDRLGSRLTGMPDGDRSELVNEIRSHIYESYTAEGGGDEIARILAVLRRLGEPADVIASRMPQAVTRLGKLRKAPLYILAGVLIACLGVPLGMGAAALLVGLLAALLGLMLAFYGTGVSMVLVGFVTALVSATTILAPGLPYTLNDIMGAEVVHFGPFQHNPQLAGVIGLILSLIVGGLGLLLLWSGRYVWRGFRFVIVLIVAKVRAIVERLSRGSHATQPARATKWATGADVARR
jgi:uncharacterized membrane protein